MPLTANPSCDVGNVAKSFHDLRQPFQDSFLSSGQMRWSNNYRHRLLEVSVDGREIYCEANCTAAVRTERSVSRESGICYYEVDVEVIQQDTSLEPQDSQEYSDICLGYTYEPDFNSSFYHSHSGNFTHNMNDMERTYGPSFTSGDTIGCGYDFVSRCYFFTKNGLFLGMMAQDLDADVGLYPAIVVSNVTKMDLYTNFGQEPFKAEITSVFQAIASERAAIQANPSRIPYRWCQYSAHPSLTISDGGRQVELLTPIPSSLTNRYSWEEIKASAMRTDFPIPSTCRSFYFEVEILRLAPDADVNIGWMSGNANLNHMLGRSPIRSRRASWGWSGQSGKLYYGGKEFPYGPGFCVGDVIGCGIDLVINQAFYTKNGVLLGPAFQEVGKSVDSGLYPAASISGLAALRINSGQAPFLYNIESHLAAVTRSRGSGEEVTGLIPFELIDHILDFVCNDSRYASQSECKNAIGRCRLTCRYWNRRCRPLLFSNVSLNSQTDVDTLLKFMAPPLAPLHIRRLSLTETLPSWAYGGLLALRGRLPDMENFTLKGQEDTDIHKVYASRPASLSDRLPSLLSTFQNVRTLSLINLYFRSFQDIAHIVGRLSRLELLFAEGLVWSRRSPRIPYLTCPLKELHVRGCTEDAIFLSLLRMPHRPLERGGGGSITSIQPPLELLQEDAQIVESIARLLITETSASSVMKTFDHHGASSESFFDHAFMVARDDTTVPSQAYVAFKLGYEDDSRNRSDPSVSHISSVHVRVVEQSLSLIQDVDWRMLDTLLSSFSRLQSATIEVGLVNKPGFARAKRELEGLMRRIAQTMPETIRRGKLQIHLDDGQDPTTHILHRSHLAD